MFNHAGSFFSFHFTSLVKISSFFRFPPLFLYFLSFNPSFLVSFFFLWGESPFRQERNWFLPDDSFPLRGQAFFCNVYAFTRKKKKSRLQDSINFPRTSLYHYLSNRKLKALNVPQGLNGLIPLSCYINRWLFVGKREVP